MTDPSPQPDHRSLIAPIVTLGVAASYVAGHGLARGWLDAPALSPSYAALLLVALAWHLAWLLPASSRSGPVMVGTTWLVAVGLCQRGLRILGLAGSSLLWATVLEGTLLWLVLQLSPAASWGDRLARWRRARADITAQLALWPGLVPWIEASMRRLLYGTPQRPSGPSFDRFMAELRDAETRLNARLTSVAMPEQARQALATSARTIATEGELAALELGMALEHRALFEAVAFADSCERLEGLTAERRREVGRQGERLLLELAGIRSTAVGSRTEGEATAEGRDMGLRVRPAGARECGYPQPAVAVGDADHLAAIAETSPSRGETG